MQGRILAVDDDHFFREFYSDILGREGYTVDVVADGKGCLDKLESQAYDLLILDLILEDMTGIDLAARIRERDRGLEIIMATKVDDLTSINRALELGIREYVLKPIHEAEFLQTVGACIERQRVFLEHGRLLAESVEHVYTLSIYKRGLAILGTLELDALVELILDGCMQECGAAGGMIWLGGENEKGTFKEAARRGLVGPGESAEFTYSEYRLHDQLVKELPFFPRAESAKGGGLDRTCIHVPFIRNKELLGFVKLMGKVEQGNFRNRDLHSLRMLGEFSAIALQNATALRDLKQRATRGDHFLLSGDRFSGLLERERATAMRYNRAFALVDFDAPPGRADLESFIQEHLRDADAVTSTGPGVYRFFLPETDGIGARSFARRLVGALRAKGVSEVAPPVHAAFPADGETYAEMESVLEHRRRSRGTSLMRGLRANGFNQLCLELLTAKGQNGQGFEKNAFLDLVHFLLTDMESDTRRRASLFLGLGRLAGTGPWLEERLLSVGKQARISIFGDNAGFKLPDGLDNAALIHAPSPQGLEQYFALYLTSESGFVALYQRDGTSRASFLSADEYLADGLILALQEQFFLQRQL